MNIHTALQNAATTLDGNLRNVSEEFLKNASETNFPLFLQQLAQELASAESDENVRQLAGLVFKNSIYAKDPTQNELLGQKWRNIGENEKAAIKQLLLGTLPIQQQKPRHTAARVVAHIALIELPHGLWKELLPQLIQTFKTQQEPNLKQSILQTIGYICEEINPVPIIEYVNPLLEVITLGMADTSNILIQQAGTQALYYALEFVKHNFDNQRERDIIMTVIFNNCNSADTTTKRIALENLVKIVKLYYSHIVDYMKNIFDVTVPVIQSHQDVSVVTQAIEFWTSLAEEEFENEIDLDKQVTAKALPYILPVLLQTLNKQDEDDDEGSWGITPAGSVCILNMSRLVGDPVIPIVLPFVSENIVSSDWKNRDAACIALGSIVDGPSQFDAKIHQILVNLLALLKDSNNSVKDTAAWTIGRICSHQMKSVAPALDKLLPPVMEATTDESYKVSAHACWTIHNICQAFEYGPVGPFPTLKPASVLIAQCLITAIHRADAKEDNSKLKINAFEALNSLINFSGADSKLIVEILNIVLQDFEKTFSQSTLDQEDIEDQYMTQKLLCSCIQAIATSYKECIKNQQQSQKIMENLLKLFTNNTSGQRNPLIYEEALLAINSIIMALESDFAPYVQVFFPILKLCLQIVEFGGVPHLAMGIVSDLSRIFTSHFKNYSIELIPLIIAALTNERFPTDYKPAAITCLGDIAASIGEEFVNYLDPVMLVLQGATLTVIEDDPDFLNILRCSILESYTEIIHGLTSAGKADLFVKYLPSIFNFITMIHNDKNRNEDVTSSAIGLLGDINQSIPSTNQALNHEVIRQLIKEGVDRNLQIANWAYETIFKPQPQNFGQNQ